MKTPHTALLAVLLATPLSATPLSGQPMRTGLATTTDVSIEPAGDSMEHRLQHGPGRIEGEAVRLEVLLPLAYEVPKERLVIEDELPKGDFDIVVQAAEGDERYALRQALEAEFGWEAVRTSQPREVYVLRALPNRRRPVTTGRPSQGSRSNLSVYRGELTVGALSSRDLASHLSTLIGRPVVDETGLDERYTVDLDWEPGDSQALIAEVRERLGLELVPAQRTVEGVVIRSGPPS